MTYGTIAAHPLAGRKRLLLTMRRTATRFVRWVAMGVRRCSHKKP